MTVNMKAAYKSEKGRRSENEDSCLVMNSADLDGAADAFMIVADGMGGRASGWAASSTAVGAVKEFCLANLFMSVEDLDVTLVQSIQYANDIVLEASKSKPEYAGMGTTCVVAAVKDGRAYYAYMGDSRAYLLRDGSIRRLTEDHSFVAEKVRTGEITEEQARTSRFRNVITKAVGLASTAQPDSGGFAMRQGDVLLLCTDGLTTAMKDKDIADILCTSSRPKEACDRLVESALRHGSRDNITVVVGAYGVLESGRGRRRSGGSRRASWLIPAVLGLVLGLGAGIYPVRTLIPKLIEARQEKIIPAVTTLDLAHLKYGDPELLLSHIPLRGRYISIDQQGYLFVVDQAGKVVHVDSRGQVDAKYPSRDTFKRAATTRSPMMAADPQGNLYISDPGGKKISKFARDGQFIGNIGEGKLTAPEALVVDARGTIFVVDGGRLKAIRPNAGE